MAASPSVSIVIPVHNMERYLGRCLASVAAQELKNIEIVCVDDGSTDCSPEILKQYARVDPRFHIIHKENGGISSARNEGLRHVTAQYVGFVDSDDWVEPDAYARAYECIRNAPDIDVVTWGVNLVCEYDGDGSNNQSEFLKKREKYFTRMYVGRHALTDEVKLNTPVTAWDKLYKVEIIRKHNILFPLGLCFEDNAFWWKYTLHAKWGYFLKENMYNYLYRNDSITGLNRRKSNRSVDCLDIFKDIYEHYNQFGLASRNDHILSVLFSRLYLDAYTYSVQPEEVLEKAKSMVLELGLKSDFNNRIKKLVNGVPPYGRTLLGNLFYVKDSDGSVAFHFGSRKIRFGGHKAAASKNTPVPPEQKEALRDAPRYEITTAPILGEASNGLAPSLAPVYDEILTKEITSLGKFYFYPNYGNMGDFVIAQAEYDMFDGLGADYSIFNAERTRDWPRDNFNLVYGGGGLFVKYWNYSSPAKMFMNGKVKRVVILPSSFYECDELLKGFDERFIVFCRDKRSYDYCRAMNSAAKFYLSNDMAFYLDLNRPRASATGTDDDSCPLQRLPGIYRDYAIYKRIRNSVTNLLRKNSIALASGFKAAYFLRGDGERRHSTEYLPSVDISSCAVGSCINKGVVRHITNLFVAAIDSVDVVGTDRLHVGIVAALRGKKVFLLDNAYNKLSDVYSFSMMARPNVRLVTNPGELEKEMSGVSGMQGTANSALLQSKCMPFVDYRREYVLAVGNTAFYSNTIVAK